jgi:DNTTIP1 dimerisation domain
MKLLIFLFNYVFLQKYFQPAVENLRKNLGNDAVSEDQIKTVCRSILEEAKQMYQPVQYGTSLPSPDCSDFENNGQISNVKNWL